jgi:phage tail-like protein
VPTGLPSSASVNDAIGGQYFYVEIKGTAIAQFMECSGLTSEIELITVKENDGRGKPILKYLPGAHKAPTITLKRAKNVSMDMYNWHKAMLEGKVKDARREASIVLLDPSHVEVSRYNLFDAWVSKITVSGLKAFSTEVAVEEATIVCERFERVK